MNLRQFMPRHVLRDQMLRAMGFITRHPRERYFVVNLAVASGHKIEQA